MRALIVTSLLLAVPAPPGGGWTQFRGTAGLTGVTDATLPDTLTVKWTVDVGESIESSAAIADGAVFVGA